jgi:hypothetical protein
MAVGDQAAAAGFAVVPDTGEEGRVRYGAREINRTRDYIAQVWASLGVGTAAKQEAAGISYGTAAPSGGSNGDIYFQIQSSSS